MESTSTNSPKLQLKNKILNSVSFEEMINLIGYNLNKKSCLILSEIFCENFQISSENNESKAITITCEEPEKSIFYNFSNSSNFEEKKIHLTNFILLFFSFLANSNTNTIHKILGKPEFLKEIFEIISLFTNFKENKLMNISEDVKLTAIEIIFELSLNFKFWKEFIEIFALADKIFKEDENSSNGASMITTHINRLINQLIQEKSRKLEHLLKIIEYTKEFSDSNINNILMTQIDHRHLLDYLLSDKNLFSFIKKLLKIFPFEIENVMNFYLNKNDTKSINYLIKDFAIDEINPKIKGDIIFKSQCKAINYHYNRYYNYEIDFQQLIELTDKNKLVLSFLIELCCRDKLYVESFHILKIFDFNLDELKIEENYLKKLLEYLMKLSNLKDCSKFQKNKVDKNRDKKFTVCKDGNNYSNKKNKMVNSEMYENNNKLRNSNKYLNKIENNSCQFDCICDLDNSTINQEFLKSLSNHKNLQINCEDFFGPYEFNCMKLPLKSKDIMFIDSIEKLKNIQEILLIDKYYSYIGFDSEWKSPNSPFEIDKGASIIQMATKNKVFIFDVIKLSLMTEDNLKEFTQLFSRIFCEKILIGFNHKNDLNKIKNPEFKKCLSELKSIDFNDVYEKKFKTKCPSLKKVCLEILNKDLCKYEQISNWENRPLRLRQLHYAALDAYVLLILFENI